MLKIRTWESHGKYVKRTALAEVLDRILDELSLELVSSPEGMEK